VTNPMKLTKICFSFAPFTQAKTLLLCVSLIFASFSHALEAAKSAALRRAEGFVAILSAPIAQRRDFVSENFAPDAELIARRGVDGLSQHLEQIQQNLGNKPPLSMQVKPDRVIVRFHTPNGIQRMHVLFTPEPEAKISGIVMQTNDDEAAMAPPQMASPAVRDAPASKALSLAERVQVTAAQHADGFSGAVLVAKRGEPIFAQAYGQADRTRKRANTLDTPFDLASNNKMFTALVIARLVEQGKLNWHDKVGKYLPKWRQKAVRDQVTIAQLLTHTSGLGMYWNDQYEKQRESLDTVSEYAELFASEAPAGKAGAKFAYSNNGYVLLGLIAEKVSGKDYYQLVRELVYQPAGMNDSDHYLKTDRRHRIAIGYNGEAANTAELALRGSPAGGGYASANDLLRFALALQAGKIVKVETLAVMTQAMVAMGPGMRYGYGFGVSADAPRHFGHLGGSPWAHAALEIYPDTGVVVIVLANSANNAMEMTQALNASVAAGG
jgi:CubicO group peptidase (beta-lactamase class C family)